MSELEIVSMYNASVPFTKRDEESFSNFLQGLLLDNIITLDRYHQLMED